MKDNEKSPIMILQRIIDVDSKPEFNEDNICASVKVKTTADLDGAVSIVGRGSAKTSKEDYDLATETVGFRIAYIRSLIDILIQVGKIKSLTDFDKKEIDAMIISLKEEVKAYINLKEKMYQRIRANRIGDNSNKVRQFVLTEDKQKALEIT